MPDWVLLGMANWPVDWPFAHRARRAHNLGTFPAPGYHGKNRVWRLSEVRDWCLAVTGGANTKPGVSGVDVAIRERMVLVPFEQTFDKGKADTKLKQWLIEKEGRAILGWAVEGARKYLEGGLMIPVGIQRASVAYLDDEDALMQFIEDCCVVEEKAWVAAQDLYPVYKTWAEDNGIKALGQRTLTKMLGERGFDGHKRDGGKRGVRGLRLKNGDEVAL